MTTTWQFEGTDMWFTSPTETLDKSILTYRKRLNDYESKIIYLNGTSTNSSTADTAGSNGDTPTEVVPTVSLDTGEIEADEQEALRLRTVFGYVDSTSTAPVFVEGNTANSDTKRLSNGMARKRNG
jgi:hypothetical protein